jgi:enhancer of polycomb-like protein
VLSAASKRHQAHAQRPTRGGSTAPPAPTAFIPTPDSTGIVDNYEELYLPGRWIDPATYIRTSETIDAFLESGLNDQFTYYMDERDKEWLDRNNEEARGEGTSAQGAVSASGTTTRSGSSTRSAKAKGKEPDVIQPVMILEDEFELAMGLYERWTFEKTPFLHHVSAEY